MALVHEAGKSMTDIDIPIRYGEYDNGYTIFAWDISRNHSIKDEDQWAPPSVGGLVTLKASFAEAPASNLCIYVVLDYQQSYTVRRDRTVVVEESPQKMAKRKLNN